MFNPLMLCGLSWELTNYRVVYFQPEARGQRMCRLSEWMSLNGCIQVKLAMSSGTTGHLLRSAHGILVAR